MNKTMCIYIYREREREIDIPRERNGIRAVRVRAFGNPGSRDVGTTLLVRGRSGSNNSY